VIITPLRLHVNRTYQQIGKIFRAIRDFGLVLLSLSIKRPVAIDLDRLQTPAKASGWLPSWVI